MIIITLTLNAIYRLKNQFTFGTLSSHLFCWNRQSCSLTFFLLNFFFTFALLIIPFPLAAAEWPAPSRSDAVPPAPRWCSPAAGPIKDYITGDVAFISELR